MTLTADPATASPLGWPGAAPPQKPVQLRRTRLLVPLVVVALLAAALGVVQTVRLHRREARAADERAALAAAKTVALALDTYDYAHLSASFDAVLKGATDPFKKQYSDTVDQLGSVLTQYQASAKGSIVGAGVAAHVGDTVTVVLLVDQTVTNTAAPEPRVDHDRLQLLMRKVHGRFLVAQAQLL